MHLFEFVKVIIQNVVNPDIAKNRIFDDVTSTSALITWAKFSNILVMSNLRIIRAKSYENILNLLKLCLEYCRLFFRTRCVYIQGAAKK